MQAKLHENALGNATTINKSAFDVLLFSLVSRLGLVVH